MSDLTTTTPQALDVARPTLPDLPPVPDVPVVSKWLRLGWLVVVVGFGGFILWASVFKLASGAFAVGAVRLSDEKQIVQHVEGGIIRRIPDAVKEGNRVNAGDVLVVLDDYNSETNLAILTQQRTELMARQARLEAVRDGAKEISFPPELVKAGANDADVQDILSGQTRQFASDIDNIESQRRILDQRIAQQQAVIAALEAQIGAGQTQLDLITQEAESVEHLLKMGLERRPRLLALQRQQAALQSQQADYKGRIAASQQQIGETNMQMLSIESAERTKAVAELGQVQASLAEVQEKFSNAQLRSRELTLRASFTGTIFNMRYRSEGAVVPPGQPMMEIVPDSKVFVVDVKVNPADIDVVQPNLPAQIRLSGLKQRTHMTIDGRVVRVSRDALQDERTGMAYFEARVAFDELALNQPAPDDNGDPSDRTLKDELYPGMPADVTVISHQRTFLDYLFEPIRDSFARAFHES